MISGVDMANYIVNDDRCICCGAIIPEGRMVCPQCEQYCKDDHKKKKSTLIDDFFDKIDKRVLVNEF